MLGGSTFLHLPMKKPKYATITLPRPIAGSELRSYLLDHIQEDRFEKRYLGFLDRRGTLAKPFHFFKAAIDTSTNTRVIVNLVTPVGEVLDVQSDAWNGTRSLGAWGNRKLRVQKALVHSIVKIECTPTAIPHNSFFGQVLASAGDTEFDVKYTSIKVCDSIYDRKFEYRVGKTVKPSDRSISLDPRHAGIYGYANVYDAICHGFRPY